MRNMFGQFSGQTEKLAVGGFVDIYKLAVGGFVYKLINLVLAVGWFLDKEKLGVGGFLDIEKLSIFCG